MSIGKHRRGRPGKAGVDYQGHTGRRVQRRGATPVTGIDANAIRQQWAARATKETTRWRN